MHVLLNLGEGSQGRNFAPRGPLVAPLVALWSQFGGIDPLVAFRCDQSATKASSRPVLALVTTLGRLGLQLVVPAGSPDVLAVEGTPEALTPGLRARLAEHKAALLALSCESCGAIPYISFTATGEARCEACAPARCRHCYAEIPAAATICAACSSSPIVAYAISIGATEGTA